MKLYDLQDAEGFGHVELYQTFIKDIAKRWNDKEITDAHYHSQLSLCYGMLFKVEECKMHAAMVPDSADVQEKTGALTSFARMLVYEKKIEEALSYYEKAYALDPEHTTAIEEAGWCCIELKQLKQAQDWFTKGTEVEDFITFWEGLGYSLAQQEKYTEALLAFKKALELGDGEFDVWYYNHLIGQCYGSLNDFYRALDHYTKCLDANPTYAKALNDLAALYCNQEGDMDKGIDYLKKAEAIAEKEDNKNVMQLVYINLARIYDQKKEFDLQEHYQAKLLELLGFGFDDEEDGDNAENEDEDEENEDNGEEEL